MRFVYIFSIIFLDDMSKCFVIVPVPMIKELLLRTDGIETILKYGLYHSARLQNTGLEPTDMIRQLLYCFHRQQKALTISLKNTLDKLVESGDLYIDEDYNGFYGPDFNPEESINDLTEICKNDESLKDEICEWYDLYQFYSLANIEENGYAMEATAKIGRKYDDYEGSPYAMFSPNLLIDLRDRYRTEQDRVRLAMLLSIISIVGKKRFAATTKKHIIFRMFGAKSEEELNANLKNKALDACYQKYTTRKVFDKLRDELLTRKLLKCYHGHAGRVYVSNQYSFNELIDEIADFISQGHSYANKWKTNEDALTKRLTSINKGAS